MYGMSEATSRPDRSSDPCHVIDEISSQVTPVFGEMNSTQNIYKDEVDFKALALASPEFAKQ